MTDKADNQITGFYGGAKIQPPIPPLSGGQDAMAIVSPDWVARMIEYVKIFKRFKVPYIFDPGQQITALNAGQLKLAIGGAKVLIGNDYEIQLILNKLKISLGKLQKMVEILIITKGGEGSEIHQGGREIKIAAAKPKKVLDPTGAGDAYRAGFIKGLIMGWPLEKCGKLAATVAVYTVEKYGTQTHRFSWQELGKRYEENYEERLI
jgi:adenosine kinase